MAYRLRPAVERGLIPALAHYGFTASGGGGLRGESVECSNGHVVIRVSADWLEGDLMVEVQRPGERAVQVEDLVDLSHVKALHMSRLPKGAPIGVVASALRKIALALDEQVPELLSGRG